MSHVSDHPARRLGGAVAPVLVLGAALALSGCQKEVARAPEPIRPVKVMVVAAETAANPIVFSGSVKARAEASLGFRVAGKIVERAVNIGDPVEAGTVLARLDATDLALSLASAEANLVSAKTRHDVAESEFGRNQTLAAKGFVTKSVLDQRQLDLDQATAALNAAQSARDQAANQAAYAELKADAAGVVTAVSADAGQVVAAGTPVVTVARDGDKEVAIAVPENKLRLLSVGEKVTARFWADAAIEATGTIREIAGSADPVARTFAVRVSLPPDPRIRLGMTATVSAAVAADGKAVVVPAAALAEQDGLPVVWVVDPANQTVSPRSVALADFAAGGVRIGSGLRPGDVVVTAGTQFMTPGKKVRLAEQPADASTEVAVASP